MSSQQEEMFLKIANEAVQVIAEHPAGESQPPGRAALIFADFLRDVFRAGKLAAVPPPAGYQTSTLKQVIALAIERAEQKMKSAETGSQRAFEMGLIEAYRFVELSIDKIARGEL